jgi:ER-bound oxygenase mpaB/B'/Rubber oxygenase, catalytic domain
MKWNDALLDPQRMVCDPPADDVIAQLVADFGADKAREVFGVLIRNIDMPFGELPSYVRAYVDTQSVSPVDVDQARVIRGQRLFVDFGPAIVMLLYFKSLPTCYLDWRGAETLAITGRLDDTRKWPEVFSRRVGETTQFLMDVMTPGSLRPQGSGVSMVLKVRLIHASIRYFVARNPRYNEALWQKPINQEDLAGTLLTFGLTIVQGLQQMQLKLSQQQAEDFYYAWKLVGHYLGIDPALIPLDLADAKAQQEVIFARLVGPSEAGESLTKALIDFAAEIMIPTDLLDNSPEFLVRYFMGDAHAKVLGIEGKKGCIAAILPEVMAKFFGALEKLEDRGLGIERMVNKLGLALITAMMKRFQSVKGRGLVVPEDLKKEWGV